MSGCANCRQGRPCSSVGAQPMPPGAWTHTSPDGVISCRTGGILDSLTVKAADTAGARIAKELAMFAILTSPAWILLLALPKRQT